MELKTLTSDVVKGKVVIVRADMNVPVKDGKVQERTRILESLPTLEFLIESGAKQIHILSHLGRPKGAFDEKFSLKVLVPELEKLLKEKVEFRKDFTSGEGKIQLHENVRFNAGEKKNSPEFIQELLKIKAEIFINDGFAVSHRPHASVIGLANYLPSYPGFLLQKEIEQLSPFLTQKKVKGLTVIIGGVKIQTKIKVLEKFTKVADDIIIGGALANTFLSAKGYTVGESFYEVDQKNIASKILKLAEKNNTNIHLPVDVICAEDMDSSNTQLKDVTEVRGNLKIFDAGPKTIDIYKSIIQKSSTIIWNGPIGVFEKNAFAAGTKGVLKAIAAQKSAKTILGGGDTLKALKQFGVGKDAFTHVSTGGGAMLQFLEGRDLPGIEVLKH